jgi:hypothetical protein
LLTNFKKIGTEQEKHIFALVRKNRDIALKKLFYLAFQDVGREFCTHINSLNKNVLWAKNMKDMNRQMQLTQEGSVQRHLGQPKGEGVSFA